MISMDKIFFICVLVVSHDCSGTIVLERTTSSLSCEGRCNENYNSANTCQCNDRCREYENCCDDFIPICANLDSCARRCAEPYNSSLPCQCNTDCQKYGNCCGDFVRECNPTTSCKGRCEESSKPSTANCYCDYDCVGFGNCCDDYGNVCDAGKQYLCKGECNVTRSLCNCTSTCEKDSSCCSDYEETCLGKISWKDEECATSEQMQCPPEYEQPPVILFSLDGFKAEYIYRNLTPNIWKIASCGVHAPYMRSVYPTKTFPNHYTIATGLYPESHGIIDNTIWDHDLQAEFRLGNEESFNPAWWAGEPIWVTTSNQGKISACYFWPGSDVNITRYPDYYYKYDGSVPNEERMYQALEWLDLPADKRPSFITLYMDNVDHAGHNYGPTDEVNPDLQIADDMIGILMNGLRLRGLENCVNLVILADHGMSQIDCKRKSSLEDYGVNMDVVYSRTGSFGRVGKSKDPSLWSQFDAEDTHNQLKCTHEQSHWQSFLKYQYLPKRYHYAYNDRIEPVLLTMDDEWLVEGRKGSYTSCNGGTHGFDNEYKSMHALFVAHGPGFKRSYNTTEPFENIEVYNLLADLIDVSPAPNNGTTGSLYHILSQAKPIPALPVVPVPNQCLYPESNVANDQLGCKLCQNLNEGLANQRLNLDENSISVSHELNMPLGRPQVSAAGKANMVDNLEYCLLTQTDYVMAYDYIKKMPFYASYTPEYKSRDLVAPESCSRSDIRVSNAAMTSCSEYSSAVQAAYLFAPELSNGDAVYDATLTTNQVPMFQSAAKIWNYMTRVIADWSNSYGGINVVSGPAFDYDFDGFADTAANLQAHGTFLNNDSTSTPIPTHYFMVVTRCKVVGTPFAECSSSPDNLDVLSFIIPNYKVEPCHTESQSLSEWIPGTLLEHVARIRDVELLTGISFLSSWTHSESASQEDRVTAVRVKLRLPQFASPWLQDFLAGINMEVTTNANDLTTSSSSRTNVDIFFMSLASLLCASMLKM
ncbi:venom phosphodiesterase 2-like [Clavelina lepadiformis]|uniref:venom phosphodiesterase 2-like n=1 Tax=Clavelina lepadiformis TaxID=159417 RepID=UPI0040432CCD